MSHPLSLLQNLFDGPHVLFDITEACCAKGPKLLLPAGRRRCGNTENKFLLSKFFKFEGHLKGEPVNLPLFATCVLQKFFQRLVKAAALYRLAGIQ